MRADLKRLGQHLLPGEAALALYIPAGMVAETMAMLRRIGGTPSVFVLGGGASAESPSDLAGDVKPVDELRSLARELAGSHVLHHQRPECTPLKVLAAAENYLTAVSDELEESAEMEQPLGGAGEWLYDNFHLIRSHGADVRRHLPKNPQHILPVVEGHPSDFRVNAVARALVRASDGLISSTQILSFLEGYQSIAPLTIAELWTFPLFVRLALIEELARLAQHISLVQQQRELAYFWADRLTRANRRNEADLLRVLRLLRRDAPARSPAFLARLNEQLHDDDSVTAILREQFETQELPLPNVIREDHLQQARHRVSVANAIGSLRIIGDLEYPGLFESASYVHAALGNDPSGTYLQSDFETRDRMRRAVEDIARSSGHSETAVAEEAIRLAAQASEGLERNASYYLIGDGRRTLEASTRYRAPVAERIRRILLRYPTAFYLGAIAALSASFVAVPVSASHFGGVNSLPVLLLVCALSLFPASEIAIRIMNALVVTLFPPRVLPKLSFESGIPEECETLVVIPMMLLTPSAIRNEVEKIEVRYLANRDSRLSFALLSDFTDAPNREMPEDESLLQVAIDGVNGLSNRYPGGRFVHFHRDRRWSETEQQWIGWERKRGKLDELNRYLCGQGSDYPRFVCAGTPPTNVRFVITLDADTQLPAGSARRLVGTIAHPLNRFQPATDGTRPRGYAIVQPRVSITLPGTTATPFTRLFTETSGTDPYCHAVSDAYQDLFGQAIFHGKAIYDLRAFHEALSRRFPDGLLLSHDLIEGAHARVALASDIELFENFPYDYQSHSRRQHRWIRGDWQILQWIFATVPGRDEKQTANLLPLIERWKIFDNLRRSLTSPAYVLLLVVSWMATTVPALWSVFVGLCLISPSLASLLDRFSLWHEGMYRPSRGIGTELTRFITAVSFLPHQAWVAGDAICRSLHRMYFSKRNLLEWETAESTHRSRAKHFDVVLIQTVAISGASGALLLVLSNTRGFLAALPFAALWIASPWILHWLRSAEEKPSMEPLSESHRRYLRGAARDTWRYFDDLVNEESNWLPPDNKQVALRVEVAQRTSPTNIGMWLNSLLAARDLGYVTTDQFAVRCGSTLDTLERLERFEGHFLNWYDTRTLGPLHPRYVSTVDSGNLIASLWTLAAGFDDALASPLLNHAALHGLVDTVQAVRRVEASGSQTTIALASVMRLLRPRGDSASIAKRIRLALAPARELTSSSRWNVVENDERDYWITKLSEQVNAWSETLDRYLRWMELLGEPPLEFVAALGRAALEARNRALQLSPSLSDIAAGPAEELNVLFACREQAPSLTRAHRAWLDEIELQYSLAKERAVECVANVKNLKARFAVIANDHRFEFLYDHGRELFYIGTTVNEAPTQSSHYDLIASEARLSSMIAIAKGDIPIEHWFRLGRPYASYSSGQLLYSWSGTMFEYLMPNLYTWSYENSLLEHGCSVAVTRQIEYGAVTGVPWGISESAYSAIDARQTYQYRAFGVPGLGLKRGLGDFLVVSPYSTMLALSVDRPAAYDNLQRLEGSGLRGTMGFYEAIDYTRRKSRAGGAGAIVYAFMAHHQGMSLLAMVNALHDDVMRERFHRDPRVKAVESLLYEGVPKRHSLPEAVREQQVSSDRAERVGWVPTERILTQETAAPRVHLLGNQRYSVVLTAAGGGYSRWRDYELTRWRSDTTRDHYGSFAYLRDVRTGRTWSAAFHPCRQTSGEFNAVLGPDRFEWSRLMAGILCRTEIAVNPEEDVEIRRFTITNQTLRTRQIELTTYCEVCIAPHRADSAHPAFQKLFVQTEADEGLQALYATRRARSASDESIWFAESMCSGDHTEWEYETDRNVFLGRGGSISSPAALAKPLPGTQGTVLDPVFALRRRLTIEPRSHVQVTLIRAAAQSREAVERLLVKHRTPDACQRVFELAWTHAELEFRHLGINVELAHRFQELATHLLFSTSALRAPSDRVRRNRLPQSGLWAHGISGDLPIAVVTVANAQGISLVREALLAHTFWALHGLQADLVVINQEPHGYDRPLHDQLSRLISAHSIHTGVDRPGGVFLRNANQIPDAEMNLILATASIYLSPPRTLVQHLERTGPARFEAALFSPVAEPGRFAAPPLPFLELPYFNGLGGFSPDGRQYSIYLAPGQNTPAPWINVFANEKFGALVSESGSGFAWFGNSQTNRLLPWSNDVILDPAGDAFFLRDEETGEVWTPTASPIRGDRAYRANHGAGYTSFEHNSHGIEQLLTVFVPTAESSASTVRIQRLRLRNASSQIRRLTVTAYAEWVLGGDREQCQHFVTSVWKEQERCLLARNTHVADFGHCAAVAAIHPPAESFTADRTEFLGRNGSLESPEALRHKSLGRRVGIGLDPCAALQTPVVLSPGEQRDVVFVLGMAHSEEEALRLVTECTQPERVDILFQETCAWWDRLLGTLQVKTPALSVDLLLNRWLLYQTLSCRIWGRSGFYQSGGAYGFRDQLQDVLAIIPAAPRVAREHIVRAASRQFSAGDVQHWWHPPAGGGVRTRCSDDRLWLPFAVAHYVERTGDLSILDERIPFLDGPELKEDETDAYFTPAASSDEGTLWEHCRRAIDRSTARGPNGLPLMGSGDWNDGMNLVGDRGRGESVWLAWFLIDVLQRFAALCESVGHSSAAIEYRNRVSALSEAIERHAWDGGWYLRAFHDEGTPLGSSSNEEAKIDSIAQTWGAISGAAEPERIKRAMAAVEEYLVREEDRIVLLFDPPFDQSAPHPGYIQGYPPGVRENGGQYTHGALWVAQAYARMGEADKAVRILQLLNPVEKTRTPEEVLKYKGEPYVISADVYNLPGSQGRCGWSWYTGSSGWMYRIWVEEVLGFQLRGDAFTLRPVIPAAWQECGLTYRYRSATYEIEIVNQQGNDLSSLPELRFDGNVWKDELIPLLDDNRTHRVVLRLSPGTSPAGEEVSQAPPEAQIA